MSWDQLVPWTGNVPMDHIYRWNKPEDITWKTNTVFEDELQLLRFHWNSSTLRVIFWSTVYQCEVSMFFTEFEEVAFRLDAGRVWGKWKFAKRGSAFGLVVA